MVKLTDEIQELMLSSAYTDSSNPKHKEVVKKVEKYFDDNFNGDTTAFKWVSDHCENMCGACGVMDGVIKRKYSDFDKYPPLHPNCHCKIIEIGMSEDELDMVMKKQEERVDEIKMSDEGKIFLKNKEGDKEYQKKTGSYKNGLFYVYKDNAGYGTIGYGHKITANEYSKGIFKNGITEEEAEKLFKKDVNIAINDYNKYIKRKDYTQNQVDAILSFLYNTGGAEGLSGSNTIYLLKNKLDKHPISKKTLEKEFKEWNTSKGEYNDGLNNRRKAEWELFTKGKYIN